MYRGFTIVEILMSVLLVSIGMFALAGMQVSAIKGNVLGADISIGANLMNARLNELKSYPYFYQMAAGTMTTDPRLADSDTTVDVNAMDYQSGALPGDVVEQVKYSVRTIITSPIGVDPNLPGAYRFVEVQVSWEDTSDAGSDRPVITSGRVPIIMQVRP